MSHEESANQFDERYYMRGSETGVSNYSNYRWIPEQTIPCVRRICQYLGVVHQDVVADVGCAKGHYVKAFHKLGIEAYGYDISKWAIENCDPDVKHAVKNQRPTCSYDWILLKDVAEHMPDATDEIGHLLKLARKGILIIVPLTESNGGAYVNPADERDVTHIHRFTLDGWLTIIQGEIDATGIDFAANASYRIPGIKPLADPYPRSCGFFTIKRL